MYGLPLTYSSCSYVNSSITLQNNINCHTTDFLVWQCVCEYNLDGNTNWIIPNLTKGKESFGSSKPFLFNLELLSKGLLSEGLLSATKGLLSTINGLFSAMTSFVHGAFTCRDFVHGAFVLQPRNLHAKLFIYLFIYLIYYHYFLLATLK